MRSGLESIDTQYCPSDFRTAFVSLIHALEVKESMQNELTRQGQRLESGEMILEGLFAAAFGYGEEFVDNEVYGLIQLDRDSEYVQRKLKRALNNVELICAKYGAPTSLD